MKHYTARMLQDPPNAGCPGVHNVFFGLFPDEDTRQRMASVAEALRARYAIRGRWTRPARYHMTLHFLGPHADLPQGGIASAIRAAQGLRAAAFGLVLDRAGHFAGRIGWLGCARPAPALADLWQALYEGLAREHIVPRGHARFTPHVTLLRDARGPLPEEPVAPVHWPVRELVLAASQPDMDCGYRVLERWPLAREQGGA